MLVKTAHRAQRAQRAEWMECSNCRNWWCWVTSLSLSRFAIERFISTCSTAVPSHPQKTKHDGLVPHPQVAETYLKYAASIDIHNHVQTGSSALEDVWKILNPNRCQLAGILHFCLANAFLAMQHFQNP